MAFSTADFSKIWASTSPLTPYEFSESNYKDGWNFVGATPPARQMWDSVQKLNDEKNKWLYDTVNPIGTVISADNTNTVSVSSSAVSIVSIDLTAGTWVVTGTLAYAKIIAGRVFAGLNTSQEMYTTTDGTMAYYSSVANNWPMSLNVSKIFVLESPATVYLNGFANGGPVDTGTSHISAVRIK